MTSSAPVRTGTIGMLAFIDALLLAPDDAGIETQIAAPLPLRDLMLVVSLSNAGNALIRVALTADEARRLAAAAEQTMRKLPRHPDAGKMPDLVRALLEGARALENYLAPAPGRTGGT